jgi:hypothetical protein
LKPKVATIEKPYFFVDITEKQFKDVLNSFSCQQRPELIRKRWEIEREKMLKVNPHFEIVRFHIFRSTKIFTSRLCAKRNGMQDHRIWRSVKESMDSRIKRTERSIRKRNL